MSLFKNFGGFMDEIRCDEKSYLIWKWHPKNTTLGKNNRENAIRWGSSLRVKDNEVVVFVYSQLDGTQIEFIEGPCDMIIETENMPILGSIIAMAYGGGTPFQAEIYFINLSEIIQMRFGVPYFNIYDYRFPGDGIPVAVRGTINFKIEDYREFVKLHGIIDFSVADLQKKIRDLVNHNVKDIISKITKESQEPLIQMENRIEEINDLIEERIKVQLSNNFGIMVTSVDISDVEIDKDSRGYLKISNFLETAEADFTVRKISVRQEVSGATDLQAVEMKAKFSKKMPDIPREEKIYYVAEDEEVLGPYNIKGIREMIIMGRLDQNSYVWTEGMSQWERISDIAQLSTMFL